MSIEETSLFRESSKWGDIMYVREFYAGNSFPQNLPVTQAQAVCFTKDDDVVLYIERSGSFGLPGGGIELNEVPEETLRREIREEINADVEKCGLMGYVKVWKEGKPDDVNIQLRYWAKVALRDGPVEDPCHNSVGRIVVPREEVSTKLGWGEWGAVHIHIAIRSYQEKRSKD